METASSGPRYAPDDPTLPEPWKGLVDGSTGILYYWNPESGVTQYEKPSSISHTQGSQAFVSTATPVMANAMPMEQQGQPNGTFVQRGSSTLQEQVNQQYQQHSQVVQSSPSVSQTQPKVAQNTQSKFTQYGHPSYQQGQLLNQQHGQYSAQYPVHNPSEMALQSQMGSHMQSQPVQSAPNLTGHNIPTQSSQMVNSQGQGQGRGQQFGNQQYHYPSYQNNAIPEGIHGMMHQQTHNTEQVPQFSHSQEHNSGFSQRTEVGNHKKSQSEFSSPQVQQPGIRSTQNFSGANPVSGAGSGAHYNQQFYGHMTNLPQSISPRVQQTRTELNQQSQRGPLLQNNVASMPSPHPAAAAAQKNTFDDKMPGRVENDYFLNINRENQVAAFQQPKMHIKSASLQNMASGNSGFAPGSNLYGNFSQATATPFSNNALVRQPQTFSHDISNRSHADAYRRQHEITTTGESVPDPFITFEGTRFPPEILMEMNRAGFSFPTPIQAQTWPIALNNCDVVAIAKTGSGKTLGYLIPAFLLIRRQRNNPLNGPTVLVLSPTRELATQIQDEVIKFGRSSRVSCTCLYGGAPKGPQLKELSSGTDIVVATPGRLNDILDMKKIVLAQISLLVLDEADRMLDMGFEPQIRRIVNGIPARRQTFMFTATWPKEVRKIAGDLLINPVQVNIGNVDELSANKSITQHVEVVSQMEKQMRLEHILRSQPPGSKIIIFCSTKRLCDQLVRVMGRGFGAAAIHGDKSQAERDWVLNQFRSGKSPILVATDVAARGLDIKDIRVVINYDFPTGIEDYVHRIGRTGRAGATGIAHTFFCDQDWKYAADLIKVLEGANQRVPPEVRDIALRGATMASARGGASNRGIDSDGDRSIQANNGDFTGRGGVRDGTFGGRGRGRDGGRGGGRDNNFSGGRGGMDGSFGGFGMRREGDFGGRDMGFGGHMRDPGFGGNNFGGQGGYRDLYGGQGGGFRRNDFVSFPGSRGRGGFGGPGGGFSRGRNSSWPHERYGMMEGGGRGRGRGRFESRRDFSDRGRSRKYSRSPDRGRGRGGYSSRSRSWSRSRSRSRSRSWTPRRSRSKTRDENGRRGCTNHEEEKSERKDGGAEEKGAPVSTTSDGGGGGDEGNDVVVGKAEAEAGVGEVKDEAGGGEEKVQEQILSS